VGNQEVDERKSSELGMGLIKQNPSQRKRRKRHSTVSS
jgi:hypothetical protein